MREAFEVTNFRKPAKVLIYRINDIIRNLQEQGYTLTVRQLYYQLVAKDIIENSEASYKNVVSIVSKGRLSGMIDWDAIEDRTRVVESTATWNSPAELIEVAARSYKEDLWRNQESYVECWVEKQALIGVLEGACRPYRVSYFACKGNTSQSAAYGASKRILQNLNQGKEPIILYLGDHDPNGLDMHRDIETRLQMFVGQPIEVKRLALNMDQIQQYNPPPNPAKESDTRYKAYAQKFGVHSWELDALAPEVIERLITDEIESRIENNAWNAAMDEEEMQKKLLTTVSENWDLVKKTVQ